MIVVGLGTGRSGTGSLAQLLNMQHNSHCFQELNPACVRFQGTVRPILNTIDEFQAIIDGGSPSMITADLRMAESARAYDEICRKQSIRMIGDVAMYYLAYVRTIAGHNSSVRFLCTRRSIDETVESWMKKSRVARWPSKYVADRLSSFITRQPFYDSANYWMNHDGNEWEPDPVWDKCFPKFEADTKPAAIRKYCEYYYGEAEALAEALPGRFRFVDLDMLNETAYQSALLDFAGVAAEDQVHAHVHANRS